LKIDWLHVANFSFIHQAQIEVTSNVDTLSKYIYYKKETVDFDVWFKKQYEKDYRRLNNVWQ
jgi:hypothetical protein